MGALRMNIYIVSSVNLYVPIFRQNQNDRRAVVIEDGSSTVIMEPKTCDSIEAAALSVVVELHVRRIASIMSKHSSSVSFVSSACTPAISECVRNTHTQK